MNAHTETHAHTHTHMRANTHTRKCTEKERERENYWGGGERWRQVGRQVCRQAGKQTKSARQPES